MKNTPYNAKNDEQGLPVPHNGIYHSFPNRKQRREATRVDNSNTVLQKVGQRNIFHAKESVIKRAIFDAGVAAEIQNAKAKRQAKAE